MLIMGLVFSSCSTVKNELGLSEKKAVTYNKLSVSESDLDADINALAKNKPLVELLSGGQEPLVKDGKLTPTYRASWANIVMRTLSIKEVRIKHKMKITKADIDSAENDAKNLFVGSGEGDAEEIWKAFPKDFRDRLVAGFAEQYALLRDAPKVTEAEIKKYYDDNQEQIATPCESGKSISHILVKTEKEAQSIKAELDKGTDFVKLAKDKSTDPGSKNSGGNLGCFAQGSFVAEFEAVASSLPVGSISGIVKTDFGFHVLKAAAYSAPTLDDVRDQIRQQLEPEKQSDLLNEVQSSLKKAKVKVLSKYGRVLKNNEGIPEIVTLEKDTPVTTTAPPAEISPTNIPE